MLKSMTGFGRAEQTVGGKTFLVDIKSLNGKEFTVRAKANDRGHLFKGVGKGDIAKTLGSGVLSEMIVTEIGTIKEVGSHEIKIAAAGASATVKINIVKEV